MNSMMEAMVKAGLVSEESARITARDLEVTAELDRENKLNERRIHLRRTLKKLEKMAPGLTRVQVECSIEALAKDYSDVFDEVATQEAWTLNLGRR